MGAEENSAIERGVAGLMALVSEALAGATETLLSGDRLAARLIIDNDEVIDELTASLETAVWERLEAGTVGSSELRYLVGILHILPELERSADLAEHIAQRGASGLGREMSPASRGIVQRMAEVGLEMWRTVADAYREHSSRSVVLDEADEELDILHERLTDEVSSGAMAPKVAAQVTLLARFYERLGDHAVNLAKRIGDFSAYARH